MSRLTSRFINSISILLFCILIGLVFAAQSQHARNAVNQPMTSQFNGQSAPTSSPTPTPTPEILHTLVGSYYLTDENIDAKLLLNNKGTTRLEVRPTLYSAQGEELQIDMVKFYWT